MIKTIGKDTYISMYLPEIKAGARCAKYCHESWHSPLKTRGRCRRLSNLGSGCGVESIYWVLVEEVQ